MMVVDYAPTKTAAKSTATVWWLVILACFVVELAASLIVLNMRRPPMIMMVPVVLPFVGVFGAIVWRVFHSRGTL